VIGGDELTVASPAVDVTRAIGAALATVLRRGDLVLLIGDLGVGKTALVGGLARGLGITAPVQSPTFALVREYRADDVPLAHLDVYRLDRLQEFYDIGIDEYLDGQWIVVVEWGDMVADALPPDRLDVIIERVDPQASSVAAAAGEPDDERVIAFVPRGAWCSRGAALADALAPFRFEAQT
jgi:tRNA threonylcarbamoyladenosine biosynthesis protein TsaE